MDVKNVSCLPFKCNLNVFTRGGAGEDFAQQVVSGISSQKQAELFELVKSKVKPDFVEEVTDNDFLQKFVKTVQDLLPDKKLFLKSDDKNYLLYTPERIEFTNGFINNQSGVFINLVA